MPSQPIDLSLSEADVVAIAQRLCGQQVSAASFCGGGGNNRVYKIDTAAGPHALKLYGANESKRDRLGYEFDGLRFLKASGITSTPAAIAIDRPQRCALYEWIDGVRVSEHDTSDIDQALEFLSALRFAGHRDGSAALPAATEAVLTLDALVEQIQMRLARLQSVSAAEPELQTFVQDELLPETNRRLARLRAWNIHAPLRAEQRILSPSDFGFHNALRRPNGALCFIDFEYFGWDDPVKLVSDFLSHPAMNLNVAERSRFFDGIVRLYGDDASFLPRLVACLPLYSIRWVLIILNEFVPELWARRAFSGKGGDWDAAKRVQLQKARAKMATVLAYTEGQSIP